MTSTNKICTAILASIFALNCIAQRTYFSGGYGYSVYICNTKTVQSWGDNYYGQLGRTTEAENERTPGAIPSLENIVSIDAGFGAISCALTANGTILTWGQNLYGELGQGVTCPNICNTATAGPVLGGETGTEILENVVAISVGQMHVYALLTSGEVVAWGNNDYGQLGDGTTTSHNTPVYVKLNETTRLSNITMIAAGGSHGYALTADGTVYAWGDNQANQLGCGDSENHNYPQLVVDKNKNPLKNIKEIDGGRQFGLMLHSNKMVYGVGAYKGTHIDKDGIHYRTMNYAEYVTGGETPTYYLENVEAISAGFSHAMAIVDDNGLNQVVAWGDNRFDDLFQTTGGQIGNGNTSLAQFYAPVYMKTSASKNITGVVRISAGCGVSYIETYNESVNENKFYVCGCNSVGQLGLGDNIDRYYLTTIKNICEPYCGAYSLGKDKTLCTPIFYDIETPFSTTQFNIKWFKDDILTDNTTNTYNVTEPGTYRIQITDISGDCPDIESDITITSQAPDFSPLYTSFCGSEIEFKVAGDSAINWYNAQNGYKIGSGNTITTSKYFCEEIIADSVYQIWVEHENVCQPIPMRSIKKCACSVPAPPSIDTAFCYNRENAITIDGDSIVWYADENLQKPILLGNTISLYDKKIDTVTLYTTSIINNCESNASPTTIFKYYCTPWYSISGTVVDDSNTPIKNAKVLLYCNEEKATDSCRTNEKGEFSLITHYCIGQILVESPLPSYHDTWAGNTILKDYAYDFEIDATIKHLTITMCPTSTNIENISPNTIWENGLRATIHTIEGQKIASFPIESKPFSILRQYPKPIYVIVSDADGNKYNFLLIN